MRSRLVRGNSTNVSIFSVNGPLNEKRLRWMRRIGGSRHRVRTFVALRSALQFGQFLKKTQPLANCILKGKISYHASFFSMTSC